jgi:hypothetical protein
LSRVDVAATSFRATSLPRPVDVDPLEQENAVLLKENKTLQETVLAQKHALEKLFTAGQIKKLMKPDNQTVHWSANDIAVAISLRSVSSKTYRYLPCHNYPLPALSTLRTWTSKFNVNQGILKTVITLMKTKPSDLPEKERLCVLSFDEVYVSNRVDINKKRQQKIGPHKSCQVVMARGLIGSWKQPVFYKFDQFMTVEIIKDIITVLYHAGFIVVAMVCDMGTTNMKVWSSLNVCHDKNCSFQHPVDDSLNVYVFAYAPHLLKLARNHLDQGFVKSGKYISKTYFEELLEASTTELTLAHKLSQYHIDERGSESQRVRPAAQLFSNTVAKAIAYCGEKGFFKNNSWEETSHFVQLMNDWFDLLNSRNKLSWKASIWYRPQV